VTETSNDKGPEAEKFVYDLSKDKLIEEYCLLNPYIKNTDNKEVCDLLIHFKDSFIIVSVKNYAFTGNQARFDKKVFGKSKDQLLGAKRKLLLNKKCVLVDKNGREKQFDSDTINNFILITLNFGHELDSYKIIESEKDAIIHNFDRDTFETILFEIDSIPEIIDYLQKKEMLYKKDVSINLIGKEKDLLAWFVSNKREFPKEWFAHDAKQMMLDIEGRWDFYNTHDQTLAKRKSDRISYFVDELVKREIAHLPQCKIIGDYLMSLCRTERRLFAITFFGHYDANKHKTSKFLSRRLMLGTFHDASCLFLLYNSSYPEAELDEYLKMTTEIYLYKYNNNRNKIIVIGTSKELTPFKFCYGEHTVPYTEAQINYYENLIKKLGWFTDTKFSNVSLKEYHDNEP
jgi:hypothetical protein